jgi:hypothetical protein
MRSQRRGIGTVSGTDLSVLAASRACASPTLAASHMRESELQVPKYQHITAVLYDEDYGGDDEVSRRFCISHPL